MGLANWTDGAVLTVSIDRLAGGAARAGSARVDLSDDRSFLSEAHRDLVDMLPNLSVHPDQTPDQGWIRIGIDGIEIELHVLLRALPPATDLVLGVCAADLFAGDAP